MAVGWLAGLARGAPVPVYPCVGPGMLDRVEAAFLSPRLVRAASPRHAALLLVAGEMPERVRPALDRVHDQLPHPRAVLDWQGEDDLEMEAVAAWHRLLDGAPSAPDRRPDAPPNPWKGEGDHGQGGEGMMGGVPYGRPMAMTAEDLRDGLALDAYSARIGPFAPLWPPGLELEITLQGDVIQSARVCAPPFPQAPAANRPAACAARLLRLLGLDVQADRVLRGQRPGALAALRAVPPGLGRTPEGSDARTRLATFLKGRAVAVAAPDPTEALPGLEWHEAVLWLNSFTPGALRQACNGERRAA